MILASRQTAVADSNKRQRKLLEEHFDELASEDEDGDEAGEELDGEDSESGDELELDGNDGGIAGPRNIPGETSGRKVSHSLS